MPNVRRSALGAALTVLLAVGMLPGSPASATSAARTAPAQAPAVQGATALTAATMVSARKKKKAKKNKRKARKNKARKNKARKSKALARPQNFARRTVRTVRGVNQITVSWPQRLNTTGYTVTWSPLINRIPKSPATCYSPCKRRFTRGTSMTLSAADLSSYARRVASNSGNAVHFKIFSHNATLLNWTGTTYPYDAWISPARTAAVDWLPTMSSQMPLPLPPAKGRDVAVTSFNVLAASSTGVPSWPSRAPKIVKQINSTGASIVATQENSNSHTGVGSGVGQYTDLANRLRPSGWALADGRDWDLASGLSRSHSTQAVRTYYKTSVWQQVANGALMTHVPIGGKNSGTNVDRWVSWTKLRARDHASTQICVINAHLLSNQGNYDKASAAHRNTETGQILSQLNNPKSNVRRVGTRVGQACAGTPTVFAGDLNSAQEHVWGNQPQAMMTANGFVDTKNAGRRYNTRLSGPGPVTGWHPTWGTQIDYLLTKGMGGAKSFRVDMMHPTSTGSDHYPVTAVVSVPNS